MITGKLTFVSKDEYVDIEVDITEEDNCNLVAEMIDTVETMIYEYLEDADFEVDEIEILINYSTEGKYSIMAVFDDGNIAGTGTLTIKE